MAVQQSINYPAIGERVKKEREKKGLSQTQLGSLLRNPMSATAISLYESGEREVSIEVLTDISKILEVPLEYLIKGVTDAPSINIALRADKDLSKNDKAVDQILDFIDYVKSKTKDK